MTNPLWIAIDTPNLERAVALGRTIAPHVGGFKLGLEFFTANGRSGYRAMAALGKPIFLDLKLHDIPNTVAKAIQALDPLAPAVLTVHAAGGRAMMEDAKAAAATGTKVVGVTMLTSLDNADLTTVGVNTPPASYVKQLTELAREAGLDGIVCSGAEVADARKLWPGGFFVAPGLRLNNSRPSDQKRIVTPRFALDSGASILVVGRPVTQAPDPLEAVRAIEATL